MPEEGLEPTLLAEPDPKSGASANFAIRAIVLHSVLHRDPIQLPGPVRQIVRLLRDAA